MKFYYGDQLIRTSKTHEYKFALIWVPKMRTISCSSTLEGCAKEKSRIYNNLWRSLHNTESRVKAIRAGKDRYSYTDGRRVAYTKVSALSLKEVDQDEASLPKFREQLERFDEDYVIVPLEMR